MPADPPMVTDLFAGQAVTLQEMLGCARREYAMRERAYPGWVERKRMTQEKADLELRYMAAIVRHFETLVSAGIEGSIRPPRPKLGIKVEQSAPPMPETPMPDHP